MKIGCIMVTEGRAPIWGIALQSFLSQRHEDKELLVDIGESKFEDYLEYVPSRQIPMGVIMYNTNKGATVPWRIDVGARLLFESGCDVVTMWDDDDYSPPDRLSLVAKQQSDFEESRPFVASYGCGWFCNLRTLHGEFISTMPDHLWGGCLAFNKVAWTTAGGFYDFSMPGYDREFVAALKARSDFSRWVFSPAQPPVAFSHGKNVATWIKSRGEYLGDKFKDWMPAEVEREVQRARCFLIEKRVFPPQP
jgi:hypothetical protein